jgi:hypothetical protein
VTEPHPALRWTLDTLTQRGQRQRALRERRRRALARNPLAQAELTLAQAEQDLYFDLVDELDDANAALDAAARQQEHRT